MSLFSLTQEIAIDLGTANTIIICDDKVVVDEPSVVAISMKDNQMVAVGRKAQQMIGKGGHMIRTVRPLRDGVIADFQACEMMIRGLIKMIPKKNKIFSPNIKMVVCIPSGSTEVEIRAVRDSSEHAGGRDVYMIYEPMAAAIGMGIDVESPNGCMIVDIGGGTTEIAVISLGGIVTNKSIKTAGDDLNQDIIEYMGRMHNLRIDEPTAERIKLRVGSALTELENPPEDFMVIGPNKVTALPMEVPVSYQEIAHCLEKSISKIENAVLQALEGTPSELYSDIVKQGIYLAGGGALLHGLAKRLSDKITIQFHVAEDPLHAVAHGTGIALKNVDRFNFLIR
ncbi:MAG: rod shape-determining protein [Paludibacter sp.]|nr:rod shape-determining protein [Bacteroidales bacterium]MCM1068545.1 rod shape-determining protein [Prevotella sp.]MCM1353209.1 rod shape-determining protein [Bacteroides sp.]MCM1442383.1 rod shape-determining protein [Muribaculum sp.]MCM1481202.1 rod shape-determining protein [Paludibacter sp.]